MSDANVAVEVRWVANPMRGDRFEELWLPAVEAALDFGATGWAFFRSKDGLLDFIQWTFFTTAEDFDRYWYSAEIAEARVKVNGLHQVPILPRYYEISGMGSLAPPTAVTAPDET